MSCAPKVAKTFGVHIFMLRTIFYNVEFSFLPRELRAALACLNENFLTEIRLRRGQPVIIEYRGEYLYVNRCGAVRTADGALRSEDVNAVFAAMLSDGVYAYSEQLKRSFVTLDGGVRVGVAGEYVVQGGEVVSVKSVTSLNIRIPHDVKGCARAIFEATQSRGAKSVLIFSPPGLGKTTMLRDLARSLAANCNVLVIDERNEIYAADCDGKGYDLGERCDVVRGGDKLTSIECAVRAMKPQVIVTDELYGKRDIAAVKYAVECGMAVCASTHVTDRRLLKDLPFEYFCRLNGIGKGSVVYDKNFNALLRDSGFDGDRRIVGGG